MRTIKHYKICLSSFLYCDIVNVHSTAEYQLLINILYASYIL